MPRKRFDKRFARFMRVWDVGRTDRQTSVDGEYHYA